MDQCPVKLLDRNDGAAGWNFVVDDLPRLTAVETLIDRAVIDRAVDFVRHFSWRLENPRDFVTGDEPEVVCVLRIDGEIVEHQFTTIGTADVHGRPAIATIFRAIDLRASALRMIGPVRWFADAGGKKHSFGMLRMKNKIITEAAETLA